MISKLLGLVKQHQYTLFLSVCIILIAFISFNLGKINSSEKGQISVKESDKALIFDAVNNPEEGSIDETSSTPFPTVSKTPVPPAKDPRVVASKNSDKYHHVYCSSANTIKEENKVWFNSAVEAQAAGYTLAGNCKP